MVKFGKNKLKALNKLAKKQSPGSGAITNKILKRKHNADKKVKFQREVLLHESVSEYKLVENVSKKELLINELATKVAKPTQKNKVVTARAPESANKPKAKPVKKQKQRQKAQINDTKLLLNLMKKK